MKIFLSTCLFLANLSPVIAVKCKVKKPDEKGAGETCTIENGACFTHYYVNTMNGFRKTKIEEGCATDCSSEGYSFTTREGHYIWSFRECCQGVKCIGIYLQKINRTLNGQECPTCFPSLSEACKGSETIKCYNAETQCIEFILAHDDSANPDKHFYGCATPTFCALSKMSMHINALSGTITRARCSDTLPFSEQLDFEG